MALADVLRAIGEGAQHQANQRTLGPDYAERLAQVKLALEGKRTANRIALQQEQAGQRSLEDADLAREAELEQARAESYPVEPGQDIDTITPEDPNRLIARFRALRAGQDRNLAMRKVESEIAENEANAVQLASRPSQKEQELELRRQQLEAQLQRAQSAQDMAAVRLELQRTQIQIAQERELRLEQQFKDRPQIPMGMSERLEGTASVRYSLRAMGQLMADPEIKQLLGPISGRLTTAAMKYLGGAPMTDKQRDFFILAQDALSQEAFAKGGQQLTGPELIRFRHTAILPEDSLGTALRKLKNRQEILTESLRRRFQLMSPIQREQATQFMQFQGVPIDDIAAEGQAFRPGAAQEVQASPAGPGSGPAVGTRKTFPNGAVGVWDGKGWVKQ